VLLERRNSNFAPPPNLIRGFTNNFNFFVDGRVKPGQGDLR
jgi:hypothetical protein